MTVKQREVKPPTLIALYTISLLVKIYLLHFTVPILRFHSCHFILLAFTLGQVQSYCLRHTVQPDGQIT
jgi:hypothetical protein